MCYTINCQATCDAYGKFINVEVKWPGSVHDARVFANCDIQNNYSSGKFNLFYKEFLPGYDCIPQLFLVDPTYPLLPYVMKEYEHCSTNEEVVFNQMLRSTRNTIECTFGKLKARCRILQRPMDTPVDKLPNIIYVCFVLHNFCEAQKSEIDPVELKVVIQEERRTQLKQLQLDSREKHKISNYKLFQRVSLIWTGDHKRLHEPLKKYN